MTEFLTGVATDLQSQVTSILPIAGGVFAAIAGPLLGFKIFKKLSGARS